MKRIHGFVGQHFTGSRKKAVRKDMVSHQNILFIPPSAARTRCKLFLLLIIACVLAPAAHAGAVAGSRPPYHQRDDVQAFVAEMSRKHGFAADELHEVFAGVEFQASVVKAMEPPSSPGVRSWERYRASFVNQRRIERGLGFMQEYAADLKRAHAQYGVPEHIVAAIIGIETIYGQNTGRYRVIDALTTLAFDYPRRAEYFRGELEQYLLLAREQGLDYFTVLGSYAGAIGLPQFMPTNVRKLAVDFDGDGKVDLRNSVVDAIGSVAHYLSVHGWKTGAPVASQVMFDGIVPAEWLQSIQPVMTRDDIRQVGFSTPAPLDHTLSFAVIPLETPEQPPEFWLGFENFYVITRYNRSTFYAMSVLQLAEALYQRP